MINNLWTQSFIIQISLLFMIALLLYRFYRQYKKYDFFLKLVNQNRLVLLLDADRRIYGYSNDFEALFPKVKASRSMDEFVESCGKIENLRNTNESMMIYNDNRYSIKRMMNQGFEVIELINVSEYLGKGANSIREVFLDFENKPLSFWVDTSGNIFSSSIGFGKYWQLFDVEDVGHIEDLGLHSEKFVLDVMDGRYTNGSQTITIDGHDVFRVHANRIDDDSFVLSLTLIGEGAHFTPGQYGALNEVLDALMDGVVATDNTGKVIYSNKKMLEFVGVNELIGKNIFEQFELFNRNDFRIHFDLPLESKTYEFAWFESPYTNTRLVVELMVSQVLEHDGVVAGYVFNFRDTSLRQSIETKSYRFAYRDSLTGVYNRHFLKSKISEMDRIVENFGVVLFDCNGLKVVNDAFGHSIGDQVILGTANLLLNNIYEGSFIIRLGGDEFAVLVYDKTEEEFNCFIENVLDEVNITHIEGLPISLACGSSYLEKGEFKFSEMLEEAELNMYRDKIVSGKEARDNIMKHVLFEVSKRNPWEMEHSELVRYLSRQIALDMNLGDEFVQTIYNAGKFHAIGKVVLPTDVIKSGGAIPEHEYEYHQHTESAFRILSAMPEYSYLANTILLYKENYDGSGKPHGLAGSDIPLSSRILRISTVMSKLLNPMDKTKKCHSISEALSKIRKDVGVYYDPMVFASLENVARKNNLDKYIN